MKDGASEISFRLNPETYAKLINICEEDCLSLQEVVENIVTAYTERRARGRDKSEKREFPRNQTSLPVVIQLRHEPSETHYRTGIIKDISMGGVSIILPIHESLDLKLLEGCKKIEILFRVPGEKHTAAFTCRPSRFNAMKNDIELGVEFMRSDLRSQQILHKYVM